MTIPLLYASLMLHAAKGTLSPRQAIKAKCIDCCNFDRTEATNCTVKSCPLYAYNPYRLKVAPADSDSCSP